MMSGRIIGRRDCLSLKEQLAVITLWLEGIMQSKGLLGIVRDLGKLIDSSYKLSRSTYFENCCGNNLPTSNFLWAYK